MKDFECWRVSSSSRMIEKNSILNLIKRCNNLRCFTQFHAHLITSASIIKQRQFLVSIANKLLLLILEKNSSSFDLLHHNYPCDFLIHYFQISNNNHSFFFNSLISAYASSTKTPEASILIYKRLIQQGFFPDLYTFPALLKSCGKKISGIREGKQIHGVVIRMGFVSFDLYVQNSLVHFYSVCGECDDASKMFDEMPHRDVVSWTGLISGYVKSGLCSEALVLFTKMDVEPNMATLVSVVVACGRSGDHFMGKALHGLMFKRVEMMTNLVVGNALMDMYVKCKCLDEAKRVFYDLRERDTVSWTCIISGLVQCERPKEALEFFNEMQGSSHGMVVSDKVTLSSVLAACASLGAIDEGRWVHEYIDRKGMEWDSHIGTAMVDMYAKCGCIDLALHVFQGKCRIRNIFMWNALLGGLAMHGHGKVALHHFEEMLRCGNVKPNEVTFLAVLSACCHSGLVDEGLRQFNRMGTDYNLVPGIEHYGCMVDLLGRAGLLNEAQELIKSMPVEPDVLIWGSLLSACKAYGNVEMCKDIQRHLVDQMESSCDDSGVYVLLSNIYASNDRWEDVTKIRRLMKKKGIKKSPGSSVIEGR